MQPKRLPYKEFKYIYSTVPRLCVDVVIFNKEGILLTKRGIKPNKGMWHIPGGTVYKEESLEEAVKRVAKDELQVEVKIVKVLGPIEFIKPSPHTHSVTIAHLVKVTKGKIGKTEQTEEFAFFKKIPENTEPEHKRFIEKYFEIQK